MRGTESESKPQGSSQKFNYSMLWDLLQEFYNYPLIQHVIKYEYISTHKAHNTL